MSMDEYFKRLQSGKLFPLKERMKYEAIRLSTFCDRPCSYTFSASRLANAGFYYTGRDDTVRCFQCSLTIGNWAELGSTDPHVVHYQRSPKCTFEKYNVLYASSRLSNHDILNRLNAQEISTDTGRRGIDAISPAMADTLYNKQSLAIVPEYRVCRDHSIDTDDVDIPSSPWLTSTISHVSHNPIWRPGAEPSESPSNSLLCEFCGRLQAIEEAAQYFLPYRCNCHGQLHRMDMPPVDQRPNVSMRNEVTGRQDMDRTRSTNPGESPASESYRNTEPVDINGHSYSQDGNAATVYKHMLCFSDCFVPMPDLPATHRQTRINRHS